jgi:adenosylcobalamin-dependent ribonucleoside-triphosphate reductase
MTFIEPVTQTNHFPHLSFQLPYSWVAGWADLPVNWGPVGYITYKRTYSRRLSERSPELTGTEEWYQTVERVVNGVFSIQKNHCLANSLPWDEAKATRTAKAMYDAIFNMKFLPPGRGLWMHGTKYVFERTAAGLYNCSFISTSTIREDGAEIFAWMMDALMLGIGVGFDTLGAGLVKIQQPYFSDTAKYTVPDSREGWVESTRILLDGYFTGRTVPMIDYSGIRPENSEIVGFGGTASGAGPLIKLHETLVELYNSKIGQPIDAELIVDTENVIGRCVVAGNVRRSAAIAIGSPFDKQFTTLKNDYEKLGAWRWNSNNTVAAELGMDYTELANQCVTNGEPGFFWLKNAKAYGRMKDGQTWEDAMVMGVNPCSEITLENRELCNLVEIFPAFHNTLLELEETAKLAYLYCKSVTLTKTHWPRTNAVMLKNRRLGISQTGIVQAINQIGYTQFMDNSDKLYTYLKNLDRVYSNWLCVPRSIKLTTVKPSGSVSLLTGATPGMHWPESEYYIRRIRFDKNSPLLADLQAKGYHVEPDSYSDNSMVVSFPVQEPFFKNTKYDVSLWEQVKLCADLQYYWADNAVSITATFQAGEERDIARVLSTYESSLKCISFLRLSETGYVQAPYEAITADQYQSMVGNINSTTLVDNETFGVGEKYCDGDSCTI